MASKNATKPAKPENTQKAVDGRKSNKLQPGMHEKQWKPGQSGNPGGRPKSIFRGAFLRVLDRVVTDKNGVPDSAGKTYADVIAEQLVASALKGKIDAVREIADRVDGKPMQAMTFGGEGGGPIPVEFRTPEERKLRIKELLTKATTVRK